MAGRLIPRGRSYAYRLFTRVPQERVRAWRAHPAGRAALAGLQGALGHGAIEIGDGLLAGARLHTRALALTHVQARGLVRGDVEPGVQDAMRRHIAPGATVYDVGANIGFFSLLAARLAGPGGAVEAFEPLPAAAAGLRRHVALNDVRTVSVHEAAVGGQNGRAQLMAVHQEGWSHLAERGRHVDTEEVLDVDIVTIDALVAGGMRPPDVVKIDVEGAEISVLEGMTETVCAHSPVIICELHRTNAEFAAQLDTIGYAGHSLDGAAPITDFAVVHALALPGG